MQNRIREHREAAGLSQAAMAERMGTTFQTVSRLERSNRGLDDKWLGALSQALDLPKAAFLVDARSPVQTGELTQDIYEVRLLRAWRGLTGDEKAGLLRVFERLATSSPHDETAPSVEPSAPDFR